MLTGLGIVQAIATLNTRLAATYGVPLAGRAGIHSGPVVVGVMECGGQHEHLALRETLNIAARLEGLAAPNAVLMSPVTARLVRGACALEDQGTHTLHGVAEPMAVSRVRGLLATSSHDEEFVVVGVPILVGREEDRGLLLAEVVQYIIAKTDGVPLYVEELTKMLLASPLPREEVDQYVLIGPPRAANV